MQLILVCDIASAEAEAGSLAMSVITSIGASSAVAHLHEDNPGHEYEIMHAQFMT